MTRFLPALIAALMAVTGIGMPILGPKYFGLSPENNATLSGALGGALIGAAGALVAMLVLDWRQRREAAQALRDRRENMKKLVTAELVNVAMGLISSKRTMDVAVETANANGPLPATENFDREMPRAMPLTDSLGPDLLVLEPEAIDALVTLKANMERTAEGMREVTLGRRGFGMLTASQLSGGLAHDMGILAECFERFGPERKFKMTENGEPELVSAILRRFAQKNIANTRFGVPSKP